MALNAIGFRTMQAMTMQAMTVQGCAGVLLYLSNWQRSRR
jgi:hypothetical protein